jgi:hypothetical protein
LNTVGRGCERPYCREKVLSRIGISFVHFDTLCR